MSDTEGGSGDMTLAFELEALRRLARPGEAFADARRWTEYVGVVSEEPTYVVTNFTRKRRIRQDFFSGPKGKRESLESVRQQFDTDRHVLVGTTDDHESLALELGWEFQHVEDAAGAAGWEFGDSDGEEDEEAAAARDDWP